MEKLKTVETPETFIDLFSGCGGFTLGMLRAGFKCLAAVDFEPHAVETLRANLQEVDCVLQRDLTEFSPEKLAEIIGDVCVDVVVGGPPCQGFSSARKRDGANHGKRLKEDPRRQLYKEFLKFVSFFRPKVFVMENVLGIRTAAGGQYFRRIQAEARSMGYRVHGQEEKAWEFGVPQKRKRQLIVGTRNDIPHYFPSQLDAPPRAIPCTKLGAAICDLPSLCAGCGSDESEYDIDIREYALQRGGKKTRNYLFNVLEVDKTDKLYNHVARPHNTRDLGDFKKLKEGENSAVAMRDHGVKFDFPYDKSKFKDRYTRQSRFGLCSTIVAHLSKDGLMFIHPTQLRSLTPREAARIQSFPDWFRFPEARTHSFRMIGNAVPPLISEAVGLAVKKYLEKTMRIDGQDQLMGNVAPVPKDELEALNWLVPLLDFSPASLRRLPKTEFLKSWGAISYLYSGLHPDGACEKGSTSTEIDGNLQLGDVDIRLLSPIYEISGWPVALVPLAEEAWRRYENGEFSESEMYRCDAQQAGYWYREQELEIHTCSRFGRFSWLTRLLPSDVAGICREFARRTPHQKKSEVFSSPRRLSFQTPCQESSW